MKRSGIAAFILVLAACGGGRPRSADVTRTDSAGVEIVRHTATFVSGLPEWRLSETPRYSIGVVDGPEEQQLFRVSGVSLLGGDTVVVVNGGSQEVRFYDADGHFLRSTGRKGKGPGEFQFPSGVWCVGDSLAVWDIPLRRLTVLGRDGRFVRVATLERKGLNTQMLGVFADGSFVTQDMWLSNVGGAMNPVFLRFAHFDADGRFSDSLPQQPNGRMGALGKSGLIGGPLFGMRTVATADAHSYWVGTGQLPQVRRFGPDGTLREVVRWPDEDRTVAQADVDRYWAKMLEGPGSERRTAQIEELEHSMPVADSFPVFDFLQSTRNDGLWIQRYRRPGDDGPTRWLVVDSTGQLVARISTPEKLRVFEIGSDYVTGTQRDDMDVEHAVVYGLEKGAPPGRR